MAQPERIFRIGACSAAVFANTTEAPEGEEGGRTFRSVVLQRRYRDGEEWKTSYSFTWADLPPAITALAMAAAYVAAKEAGG